SARYIFIWRKPFNLLVNVLSMSGGAALDFPLEFTSRKAEAGMSGVSWYGRSSVGAPPSRLRRHLLHEGVGVGRRHGDLGAADVGIERLEHGVSGVGGVAGKAAVAGKGRQAGLDRLLVERRVAERVVRRHHGGDLLRRSAPDPFERAHQGV